MHFAYRDKENDDAMPMIAAAIRFMNPPRFMGFVCQVCPILVIRTYGSPFWVRTCPFLQNRTLIGWFLVFRCPILVNRTVELLFLGSVCPFLWNRTNMHRFWVLSVRFCRIGHMWTGGWWVRRPGLRFGLPPSRLRLSHRRSALRWHGRPFRRRCLRWRFPRRSLRRQAAQEWRTGLAGARAA